MHPRQYLEKGLAIALRYQSIGETHEVAAGGIALPQARCLRFHLRKQLLKWGEAIFVPMPSAIELLSSVLN
jgi:hypothetical protein